MFSWLFNDFDITQNISKSIGNPGKRHIYNYRLGIIRPLLPKKGCNYMSRMLFIHTVLTRQ